MTAESSRRDKDPDIDSRTPRGRDPSELRRLAEEILRARESGPAGSLSPMEIRDVVHELRVHQIELEMQNEELRRIQEDLEISRARYFDLYDMAPVGYCSISEQEVILEANLTAVSLLGYSRREMIGQPFTRFIVPEDQDSYYHHRKRLWESGDSQLIELRLRCREGAKIWARLESVLADLKDGSRVCRAVVSDITEEKMLLAEFHQAQKMESVGRLAGGVAHDFNNMLTVILGHCVLLRDRLRGSDGLRDHVGAIYMAANRAKNLTRQLLAYSRKQVLKPEYICVNQLVANVETMVRKFLSDDIALELQLGSDIGTVYADAGQLEQVIVNLAVNARDAMNRGGCLSIETDQVVIDGTTNSDRPPLVPGSYARLTLRDTGCGMDGKTLSRVFEPFFTTKGVGKGTGLGLSMVYGVVRQSGGDIHVESEPGKGSTFHIFLPTVTEATKQA